MEQPSLFGGNDAGPTRSERFFPNFDSWWASARRCLDQACAPDDLWWHVDREQPHAPPARAPKVLEAFFEQARCAACHRAEDRFALMYQILWRLHHGEAHLLEVSADRDVVRLLRYAKAVRRDRHKMKAFVRFREVDDGGDEPRFVAWFEPDHFIVELTAPFFVRRFTNMRWSILTPEQCAHWEGDGDLWFSAGVDKSAAPADDRLDDAWRIYYQSIFNPARLKVNAMRSEMPQKYWKNLPEARLIPELVRQADARVERMAEQRKTADELRCGPRPDSPAETLEQARAAAVPDSMQALQLAAQGCQRCPLWQPATQVVFGEGPTDATVMVVGEQPGDQEDLTGRPFVGPAGQLLEQALCDAAIARETVYLTNAVKHFGFTPRGRRRMHQRPTIESVHACSSWLFREIDLVRPEVLVCLGKTAASAVLGYDVDIARQRGRSVMWRDRQVLITVHPAYLLRRGRNAVSASDYRQFVAELAQASSLSRPSTTA
ncbi:MAG: UdgX family uracil-DNA binding protein [Gammaproteobacteria bacterium]